MIEYSFNLNPVESEKYRGYYEVAKKFYKVWNILETVSVSQKTLMESEFNFLRDEFLPWFKEWQDKSTAHGIEMLKLEFPDRNIFSAREISMFFLTEEATSDIFSFVSGIDKCVRQYIPLYPEAIFHLKTWTSDVNEHSFGGSEYIN